MNTFRITTKGQDMTLHITVPTVGKPHIISIPISETEILELTNVGLKVLGKKLQAMNKAYAERDAAARNLEAAELNRAIFAPPTP